MMWHKDNIILIVVAMIALTGAVFCLFFAGITGPFLLDDYANLSGLSHVHQANWVTGTLQYLATNTAGLLGRPVSLLSFLIDADNWPADPAPFKRTNIALHAVTTLLVFFLTTQVAPLVLKREGARAYILAGFVAAIFWAVHPIQVSTVLYVVQRMTILSTLFSLAALSFFLAARVQLDNGHKSGWLLFGFLVCAILAVFSKENGALVFALAWLLDWLLFSGKSVPRWYVIWRRIFIIAPIAILVSYFVVTWDSILGGYSLRDFTLAERLMTQPRVLGSYLGNILVPQTVMATLYHDSYIVSRSFVEPISTLAAVLMLIAAVIFAFVKGRSFPLVALPILWFLVAHSIESSVVPLEMVFEHRNYLPSIGFFLSLGLLLAKALAHFVDFFHRALCGGVIVSMLALTAPWTYQAVKVWSDESLLIYTWAFYDERSMRAQTDFAQLVAIQGQPSKAIEILTDLKALYPDELTVRMRLASFYCEYKGEVPSSVWNGFDERSYQVSRAGVLGAAQRYHRSALESQCAEIDLHDLVHVFSLLKNREQSRITNAALAHIHYIEGNFLFGKGAVEQGMKELSHAADIQPTVDVPLRQSILMLNLADYAAAEHYLQIARQRNQDRSWRYPSRRAELDATERQIQKQKYNQVDILQKER